MVSGFAEGNESRLHLASSDAEIGLGGVTFVRKSQLPATPFVCEYVEISGFGMIHHFRVATYPKGVGAVRPIGLGVERFESAPRQESVADDLHHLASYLGGDGISVFGNVDCDFHKAK